MTDFPIIFSASMILALVDGRKTMTRRLAWKIFRWPLDDWDKPWRKPTIWQKVCPGDRLWVKETFYETDKLSRIGFLDGVPKPAVFRADIPQEEWKFAVWTPSIFMPRRFSRLTLVVTAARIERLHEITPSDVVAEGAKEPFDMATAAIPGPAARDAWEEKALFAFEHLWESLHGKSAWEQNPEVVVLSFETHKQNIDKMGEAA